MLRKKELEKQKIEEEKKADMSTSERLYYEMSSLLLIRKKAKFLLCSIILTNGLKKNKKQ